MTDKLMTAAAKTLTTSLDNTQKNAINIDRNLQGIISLSGKNTFDQATLVVIKDQTYTAEEKKELTRSLSEDYTQRLTCSKEAVIEIQNAQTENIINVTNCWAGNLFWILLGTGAVVCVCTPGGRKLAGDCVKYLMS